MFGIGFTEMLLIGVVILIAVGPKRLPQLMKTVGHGVREIRRASNELRRTVGFDEMMREADVRQALREPVKAPVRRAALTAEEREQEQPEMGVDLAEAAHWSSAGRPVPAARPSASSAEGASVPGPASDASRELPSSAPAPEGAAVPPPAPSSGRPEDKA